MSKRMSREEKAARYAEALARAERNLSTRNYPTIFEQFAERGIPESEIVPRVNVLTFNAWKAKGRFVKRGEKAVRILTYVPVETVTVDERGEETIEITLRPKTACVFHISQTEESRFPARKVESLDVDRDADADRKSDADFDSLAVTF